jgi:phosphomannomutase
MSIPKKVIVCDLDGTLAVSKSPLSKDMAEVLCHLLETHYLAVISGGSYTQFQKQFLTKLPCGPDHLKNLSIYPTMGSTCYVYDDKANSWKQLYNELLSETDRKNIIKALNEAVKESKMNFGDIYGDLIEDRGSQVTFSGRGQNAPAGVKAVWDPYQEKRKILVELLKEKLKDKFEIRIGGATSIDITQKGIDKGYAIGKIKDLLKVTDDNIIFIGDALYKGGNDEAVKVTGVDFIQEDGPDQTLQLLSSYM